MQLQRILRAATVSLGLCTFGLGSASAEDKPAGKNKEPDMQAMMAAYENYDQLL